MSEAKIEGFEDAIRWYDRHAEKYASAIEEKSSPEQINNFVSLLPEGGKVLDAGCAAGRDSRLLADKGLEIVGLDLSQSLLDIAKRRHPDIKFVHGNFLNLPFENDSFDGVWTHASLIHLETTTDVKKALGEFNRVLKTNGAIHVLVKAQTGKEKTAVVSDKLSKHERFFQYFTENEVQGLLKDASFEIVSIEQYRETDRHPDGRPEVSWILALGKKQ